MALAINKNVTILVLVFLCFTSSSVYCSADYNFVAQTECLKIPANEFIDAVQTTLGIVRQVTSLVSGFTRIFGDFRLANAISDCLDLLELSTDELTSTLYVTQNPHIGTY